MATFLDGDREPVRAGRPETRGGDIVVIGEVSVVKSVLLILVMAAFVVAVLASLPKLWHGRMDEQLLAIAAAIFFGIGGIGVYLPSMVFQVAQRGRVLYVQNDRIHWRTLRDHQTAGVDELRSAKRDIASPRNYLRSQLIVEFERPMAPRPRWAPAVGNRKTWSIDTGPFRTPISVMLDRLEALGAKIEGSKTDRFDI